MNRSAAKGVSYDVRCVAGGDRLMRAL